jgi:hypothetical protein
MYIPPRHTPLSCPEVHSSLVEALPVNEDLGQVSSEKEEVDAVVAELVSEEKGAKGWALRHTRVVASLLVLLRLLWFLQRGLRKRYSSRQ